MNIDELLTQAQITILIGRNGSGKSTLLRDLDGRPTLETKYISPERGGTLKYDPGVDNNMSTNANWLTSTRRKNRFEQFRQQSAAQFRNLETAVLREIEKDHAKRQDLDFTFDATLSEINNLLPAIQVVRSDRGFSVATKTGEPLDEDAISSGESELISLAIEALVFSREERKNKLLLLDEPDVHLHPDLQHKFVVFLLNLVREFDFRVVIATHSTAIFAGLAESNSVQIVPIIERGQIDFSPFRPDDISRQLLPVFGIHPLASHFNSRPILLVEGEDDRRVIEQIVRSAPYRFAYSPAVVGSVDQMNAWEVWLDDFLPAIYDEPKAFSLRDLDNAETSAIDDLNIVTRARLNCYAIENLLLSEESLNLNGFDETSYRQVVQAWIDTQPQHQSTPELAKLLDGFRDRRTLKIKGVRNMVCALLGTSKPWEVLVGQLLAKWEPAEKDSEHSIYNYLGGECVSKLFS